MGLRRVNPAVWFVAPALLAIAIFFFVPVAAALLLSFTDFDIYALADRSHLRPVGLANYAALLHAPRFWTALRNTLYFVVVGGPLSVAASLGAALLVNARCVRWKGLFRTLLFLPVVTTLVAVAVVWRYLYHPRYGLLNHLLALDGARGWQQFRHVTLPMLAPTFLFVAIITMIGYFQLFAEPYVMTQGGPANATLSVVLLMYEEGFRWWNMGFGAAIAFILFAIILAFTLVQLRVRRLDMGAAR